MNRAERAQLVVVDETDEFLVVDKPGGLICHPTNGDEYSSLISRIRLYLGDNGTISPHFVNRLDRETSGLVLISKRREGHKALCLAYEEAEKTYWAVVHGWPTQDQGLVDQNLGPDNHSLVRLKRAVVAGGQPARTAWKVVTRFQRQGQTYSLLEVQPFSGRTHQIRVHLSYLGHPVVGDKIYGSDETFFTEALESGWTQRLEKELVVRRHLLSALQLKVLTHHWRIEAPQDLRDFLVDKTYSPSAR